MSTNINTNFLSFEKLVARNAPDASVLSITAIDFGVDSVYSIDLTATVQSAQMANPIQAVFVDASAIPVGFTILSVSSTRQQIQIAPGSQGYYPLLIGANSYIFRLTNTACVGQPQGSCLLNLFFVNVPFVATEWNAQNFSSGGSALIGAVRKVTGPANDQMTSIDCTILADATNGTVYENLPPLIANSPRQIVNIIKTDSSSNVIDLTVNGSAFFGPILAAQNDEVTLQWNGTNWTILNQKFGSLSCLSGMVTVNSPVNQTVGLTINEANTSNFLKLIYNPNGSYGNVLLQTDGGTILSQDKGTTNVTFGGNPQFGSANFYSPSNLTFGSNYQAWGAVVSASGSMTVTSLSIAAAQYIRIGPLVHFYFSGTFNLGGTASNTLYITPPVASYNSGIQLFVTGGIYLPGVVANEIGWAYVGSGFITFTRTGASNFPLVNGANLSVSGTYRVA